MLFFFLTRTRFVEKRAARYDPRQLSDLLGETGIMEDSSL